jgi:hypothetical protein
VYSLPASGDQRWRVHEKVSLKKIGWQHGIFITFNISQILNIILGIKGGCGNEHSKGMATMRKLGMAPRRYNGASHGSMDTLKSRIMRQRSGWSGWEVSKEEKNPKCSMRIAFSKWERHEH